jgi:hypothetical protein
MLYFKRGRAYINKIPYFCISFFGFFLIYQLGEKNETLNAWIVANNKRVNSNQFRNDCFNSGINALLNLRTNIYDLQIKTIIINTLVINSLIYPGTLRDFSNTSAARHCVRDFAHLYSNVKELVYAGTRKAFYGSSSLIYGIRKIQYV